MPENEPGLVAVVGKCVGVLIGTWANPNLLEISEVGPDVSGVVVNQFVEGGAVQHLQPGLIFLGGVKDWLQGFSQQSVNSSLGGNRARTRQAFGTIAGPNEYQFIGADEDAVVPVALAIEAGQRVKICVRDIHNRSQVPAS